MPRHGWALQERRELVGYKTQSDMARASRALEAAGKLPGDLKSFSQQWLSALEDDRTGATIGGARPRMIRTLAYMLRWSAAEFEEHVGVSIPSVPSFDTPLESSSLKLSTPTTDDVVIPDALKEAAEIFGSRPEFAELREPRWTRFLAELQHRRTPQTAGDWLAVFLDLRDRLEPPR